MPSQGPAQLRRLAGKLLPTVTRVKIMKIKANGITIDHQVDGPDGVLWIVFSNSLATSTAMWDDQAASLKDLQFRVPRYDQRRT